MSNTTPVPRRHQCPTLIQRADQALYQAKRQGRNRTVAWTAKMEGEDVEKAVLVKQL